MLSGSVSGTGAVEDWSAEYHAEAAKRRTPAQEQRRAELRALRDDPTSEWTPALDRESCLLTWLPDFADSESAPRLVEATLESFGPNYAVNAAVNADWRRVLADGAFERRLHNVTVPVLIVHGDRDPRPPRLAERLAQSLPNARLAAIPGAGHWPWLEQPETTRAALRSFLLHVART